MLSEYLITINDVKKVKKKKIQLMALYFQIIQREWGEKEKISLNMPINKNYHIIEQEKNRLKMKIKVVHTIEFSQITFFFCLIESFSMLFVILHLDSRAR